MHAVSASRTEAIERVDMHARHCADRGPRLEATTSGDFVQATDDRPFVGESWQNIASPTLSILHDQRRGGNVLLVLFEQIVDAGDFGDDIVIDVRYTEKFRLSAVVLP